ncbi:MAG: site-specific methylase [Proteobacteria bacterium]|nr:site-specific methylase [Pseudomonadota bacterium]
MRHLYGAMPEPSTADLGAASWMALLAASRASHIVSPAGGAVPKILATSGPRLAASSCNPARGGVSSRTSRACSPRRARSPVPSASAETYKDWVLRLREDFSRRRKLAQATRESEYSSSAWPTALVANAGEKVTLASKRPGLMHAVVSMWPTATTRDHRSLCASQETMERNARPLSEFVGMWATPRAGHSGPDYARRDTGKPNSNLATDIALWSTPRATDGEKGGPNMSFGAGGEPLPSMAANWMSPRVSSGPWMRQKNGTKKLTIDGQACRFTPPSPETRTDGETSSPERRSLNPQFVEWLMGWPPGWTRFACSATELFLWKARMRSALSSLDSPREAPPAQLSLAV